MRSETTGTLRNLRTLLPALAAASLSAAPAYPAPRPAPSGVWIATPASSGDVARCTLSRTDGAARVAIETKDARTEIYATSGAFFTHPSMTYPIAIVLDGAPPIETRGPGEGEHGVRLAPGEGLTGDALLARMARASSMTVKEDIWTYRFDLAGLAEALPKLEACRKTEGERAAAERARLAEAEAENARACEALTQTILKDVGGLRSDRTIAHPLAQIWIACPAADKASIDLQGMQNGFAPEFLQLAAQVAAGLAGQRPEVVKNAPADCLKRVVVFYKTGKVGRHHPPSADTPRFYEGTLTVPRLEIRCSYVGADKRDAYFRIGRR